MRCDWNAINSVKIPRMTSMLILFLRMIPATLTHIIWPNKRFVVKNAANLLKK